MSSDSGATYSVPLLTTTSQASGSSISIISPTLNAVSPPPTVPSASQAVSPPPPTVPSASEATSMTFQDDSLEEYPPIENGSEENAPEGNSPEGNGLEEDDSNELIKTLYDMYEIVMELNNKVDSIVISKEAVAAVTMACNGSSRDSSSDTGISNLDIKLSALDDKINTMTRVLQSLKTPYGDSGMSTEGQEGGQRRKKGATQKKKRG
jgi:hypothetical protein